ncbi:hypothetical protein ACFGVR_15275 [Mucilaginibacter sp. AW1-3]
MKKTGIRIRVKINRITLIITTAAALLASQPKEKNAVDTKTAASLSARKSHYRDSLTKLQSITLSYDEAIGFS